jgi:hypothetical protein
MQDAIPHAPSILVNPGCPHRACGGMSLLDACLHVAASRYDELPRAQLEALPGDLVQMVRAPVACLPWEIGRQMGVCVCEHALQRNRHAPLL